MNTLLSESKILFEGLQDIISEAREINRSMHYGKSELSKKDFLDTESKSSSYSDLLECVLGNPGIIDFNTEEKKVLGYLKDISEKRGIFFLLSFLYKNGFFTDTPSYQKQVAVLLQDFGYHVDRDFKKIVEETQKRYDELISPRKTLPYYPNIEKKGLRELEIEVQNILELLLSGAILHNGKNTAAIDDFLNFLYRENILTQKELLKNISSNDMEGTLFIILKEKVQKQISNLALRKKIQEEYEGFIKRRQEEAREKVTMLAEDDDGDFSPLYLMVEDFIHHLKTPKHSFTLKQVSDFIDLSLEEGVIETDPSCDSGKTLENIIIDIFYEMILSDYFIDQDTDIDLLLILQNYLLHHFMMQDDPRLESLEDFLAHQVDDIEVPGVIK